MFVVWICSKLQNNNLLLCLTRIDKLITLDTCQRQRFCGSKVYTKKIENNNTHMKALKRNTQHIVQQKHSI